MDLTIGFIGFGEAAQAFVGGWREAGGDARIVAYDLLFDDERHRAAKLDECRVLDVGAMASAVAVREASDTIICAVTADQVIHAARSVGPLKPGQHYLDINSAAPEKKQAAAAILGESYVDVAVLSPVHPKRHQAPILIGGPSAAAYAERLAVLFPCSEVVGGAVGDASRIKMIRSIFVKGIEAVATECALAAYKAGLADRIFPSLDIVLRHDEARALADYALGRVAEHGVRRHAEMEEVCAMLEDMHLPNAMSQAAATVQKMIGEMQLSKSAEYAGEDAGRISKAVLERLAKE